MDQFGLSITTDRPTDHEWIVVVEGEVDLHNAHVLEQALARIVDTEPTILSVDLHRTTFMDSTGIRTIVRYSDRLEASGGRLQVVHTSAAVARVLEIAGVIEHLRAPAKQSPEGRSRLVPGGE